MFYCHHNNPFTFDVLVQKPNIIKTESNALKVKGLNIQISEANKHSTVDEWPKITIGIFGIQAIKAGVDQCLCIFISKRYILKNVSNKPDCGLQNSPYYHLNSNYIVLH